MNAGQHRMEGNGRKLHAIHAAQGEGGNPRTLRGVLFTAEGLFPRLPGLAGRSAAASPNKVRRPEPASHSMARNSGGGVALFTASPEKLDRYR